MITINFLRHFVEAHAIGAYVFLYLGVILEGEIVVILAGIFSHLGSLHFIPALLVTIVGGVTKSFFGYALGKYLEQNHSNNKFIHRIEHKVSHFFPSFHTKPFWAIFVSRFFLFGLSWFTLIFSGYKKVDLKTYFKAECMSLGVWAVGMLSLGYFFSYTALSISHDVRKFLLIILACFMGFFVLEKVIGFILGIATVNISSKKDSE